MSGGFGLVAVALAATVAGCARSAAATSSPTPRTVLVELFTSQGCSSCPPADAFVRELPALGLPRTRVVPLTFHVDYWNGLGNAGWKDPFSSPVFTQRQQRYADAGFLRGPDGRESLSGLYTPQMIVDGTVHFSGGRRDVALAEIRRAAETSATLALDATAAFDPEEARVTARVTARAAGAPPEDWRVVVVVAARSARTNVTRGENAGEVLEEAAVVRALSVPVPVSLAAGATPARIVVARPRDLTWSAVELAVVVQSARTLHVAAAQSIVPVSKD